MGRRLSRLWMLGHPLPCDEITAGRRLRPSGGRRSNPGLDRTSPYPGASCLLPPGSWLLTSDSWLP